MVTRFAKLGSIALSAMSLVAGSPASRAETTGKCELHVWPSRAFYGATVGSGYDGVLPALMKGKTDDQVKVISTVLDEPGQIRLLDKMGLRDAFGLAPDTAIIFHPWAHDSSHKEWQDKARNSTSTASCYYELRVYVITFTRHPLYGKSIITTFNFQAFGPGSKALFSTMQDVNTKMPDYPSKVESDPATISAVSSLVTDAFTKDVTIFGSRISKRLPKVATSTE